MDLLAYAQIEEYENLLKNNHIEIPRLRGIDPCESMKPWTDEECRRSIERHCKISKNEIKWLHCVARRA